MLESIFKINLEDKNKIIQDPMSKNNYLIWVECNDKNFYNNIKLLHGEDLADKKGFYVNHGGNIVNEKGWTLIQGAVFEFPELLKVLFENGCGLNSSTDLRYKNWYMCEETVKLAESENGETQPKFEIESIGNPNEKYEIYIDSKGNFADKDGKSICIFGNKVVHENEEDYSRGEKNITDIPLMIDLARKQKLDINIFKYIQKELVKNSKPGCSYIALHLQRENLKTGEIEDIYVDEDYYVIDKETGEKINDKDSGQPYKIQEKYPEINSHICKVIRDEDEKPTSRIKDAAMIYEISDFEVALNGKTGFLMTMKNIFNPFKSVMFFVDKKDGKIYDENGKHPQKITDIANCKFENSSLDQCSNIFSDPELYSMYQELVKNKRDNFLKYYVDDVEIVEYTDDKGEKVSDKAISFNAEIFGDETRKCYIDRYGDMFLLEQEGDVKKAYYCGIVNGYL